MKKTLIIFLSMLILLLSSCGGTNNSNNNGGNTGNLSQDDQNELFLEVKQAIIDSLEYDGDLTIKVRYEDIAERYDSGTTFITDHLLSYNGEEEVGFVLYKNFDDVGNVYGTFFHKEFSDNGIKYAYSNCVDYEKTGYFKYPNFKQDYYKEKWFSEYNISSLVDVYLRGTHLADSYQELVSSYETVYKTIIGNTAIVGSEYGIFDVSGSSNISINKKDDIITLTIKEEYAYSEESQSSSDGNYESKEKVSTTKHVDVQDGKITRIYYNYDRQIQSPSYNDHYNDIVVINFEYEFDQSGYDDIKHDLTEAEEIYDIIYQKRLVFETDKITHKDEYIYIDENTNLEESLLNYLDHEYFGKGHFRGVFLDKEHTKRVTNETFSFEDLTKTDKFYVDVVLEPNYALVRPTRKNVCNLSKMYSIVLGDNWIEIEEGSSSMSDLFNISSNNTYEVGSMEGYGKIYVNGVEFTDSFIQLKSQEEYYVVYEYNWTESNVVIDILIELFEYEYYKI